MSTGSIVPFPGRVDRSESGETLVEDTGTEVAAPGKWGQYGVTPAPLGGIVPTRLASLDAYRGLVMILMVSAGLYIGAVVHGFDETPGWQHLKTRGWEIAAYQTDHPEWAAPYRSYLGDFRAWGTLWDQIQSSFMFMVGAALAFSIASRQAKGQSFGRMLTHALIRSAILVGLSVILASNGTERTNWSFTIVLAQIGLGYPFLFLLAWLRPRWQILAAVLILVGYWAAFALYPAPPQNLDLASVNLPADWQRLTGFAAHWEKNTNLAAAFDQWFLNLFPRHDGNRFTFESGGYQTLNFIPSLATMIFGLLAGELLRGRTAAARKIGVLLGGGIVLIALGWLLGWSGVCPIVKRIWTPSWAIYSAGWAFLMLGLFYLVVDVWGVRRWTYPLVVVGANSIVAYCISMTMRPWLRETMRRHLGPHIYELPGRAYAYFRFNLFSHGTQPADFMQVYGRLFAPMIEATAFLLFLWLICWWMYRKCIFVKI